MCIRDSVAIGLNVLAMAVLVLIMRPSFETNDDLSLIHIFCHLGQFIKTLVYRCIGYDIIDA